MSYITRSPDDQLVRLWLSVYTPAYSKTRLIIREREKASQLTDSLAWHDCKLAVDLHGSAPTCGSAFTAFLSSQSKAHHIRPRAVFCPQPTQQTPCHRARALPTSYALSLAGNSTVDETLIVFLRVNRHQPTPVVWELPSLSEPQH